MGSQRELEVTVLSAQDLKNVKLTGGTMNPYCVAWVYPHHKVAGGVNNGGGVNPTWNSVIKLPVEESLIEQGNANVTVEIYNHGKFSNKFIGSASVPLSDLKGQSRGSSYQVRKKSGKNQGMITVAVRQGRTLSAEEVAKSAPPVMAYPAGMAGSSGQYGQQQYGQQQYGQQQYPQQYQQQYGQQQYPQQQYVYQQTRPRRSGFGGGMAGPGMGLGAGLLGGMLLGGAMDGGFGGDGGGGDGGGGGCGGGGCGG